MDRDNIKELIKEILEEVDPLTLVEDDTELIGEILDSLSVLYLFSELQERLEIVNPMQEATIENFSTVENVATLVEKYLV